MSLSRWFPEIVFLNIEVQMLLRENLPFLYIYQILIKWDSDRMNCHVFDYRVWEGGMREASCLQMFMFYKRKVKI